MSSNKLKTTKNGGGGTNETKNVKRNKERAESKWAMKGKGETNRKTFVYNKQLHRVSAYLTTLPVARTT
jgi:hypothetical protein